MSEFQINNYSVVTVAIRTGGPTSRVIVSSVPQYHGIIHRAEISFFAPAALAH